MVRVDADGDDRPGAGTVEIGPVGAGPVDKGPGAESLLARGAEALFGDGDAGHLATGLAGRDEQFRVGRGPAGRRPRATS